LFLAERCGSALREEYTVIFRLPLSVSTNAFSTTAALGGKLQAAVPT
jgi:hypothetical protein